MGLHHAPIQHPPSVNRAHLRPAPMTGQVTGRMRQFP